MEVHWVPGISMADALGASAPGTARSLWCSAELLIDCEEDRPLRAVLVGMLRKTEQGRWRRLTARWPAVGETSAPGMNRRSSGSATCRDVAVALRSRASEPRLETRPEAGVTLSLLEPELTES